MPNGLDYPASVTLFSNAVVTFGLLFQALLVGAASSVVQSLDSAAKEYSRKLKHIRSYLDYKRVPTNLKRRVIVFYRFMWSSVGSLDQSAILPNLPAPLCAQMDIAQTRSIFVSIPVFQMCEPHEILRMVQGLLTHLALPGDVLLKENTVGRGLFFIMRGKVSVKGKRPKLTDAQTRLLRQKFDQYDDDRSGSIDYRELSDAVLSIGLDRPPTKTQLRKMMEEIDQDGSGQIEFGEFVQMLLAHKDILAAIAPDQAENLDEGVELTEGFFGEETVLTGQRSTLTVQAVTYSDFFVLPTAVFNSVLEHNEAMRKLVDEYAARRAARANLRTGPKVLNQRISGAGAPALAGWRRLRATTRIGSALKGRVCARV